MKDFEVIDLTGLAEAELTAKKVLMEVVDRFPEKKKEIELKEQVIEALLEKGVEAINFQWIDGLSLPVAVQVNDNRPGMNFLDTDKRKEFCLKFSDITEVEYDKLCLVEDAYLYLIGVLGQFPEDASEIIKEYQEESFVDSRFYNDGEFAQIAYDYFGIQKDLAYKIDAMWMLYLGQGWSTSSEDESGSDIKDLKFNSTIFDHLLANPPFGDNEPNQENKIYDPACGSGSFLIDIKNQLGKTGFN